MTATAPDSRIREYATATGAVIMTKDEDFAVWRLLHDGPAVVWFRLGDTRRAALLARVELEVPAIVHALERGDTLIEIT
jgi:predicted nuclease of predicted toxin-antitoxin system